MTPRATRASKRARARVARAMATAMRVVGNKEVEGNKATAMARRMAGECTAMATKRAMATATRVVGDKEGNGNDGKSNGDSDEGSR